MKRWLLCVDCTGEVAGDQQPNSVRSFDEQTIVQQSGKTSELEFIDK